MCVPQDDSGARGPLGSENAGGVAVEVLPRPVVAHGYARVGVARGDATTSAADACVSVHSILARQ
jgi:hypothetical protein